MNDLHPADAFKVGGIYNRRREIHGVYGGQPQGGMATPARYAVIFLFTGDGGEAHGYVDRPMPDGTFWYTGEGQRGNMEFIRSNRALRDHREDGKRCCLFEAIGRGSVRYIGEVEYLGHHREERPDTNGDLRQAIVFELGICTGSPATNVQETTVPYRRWSLADLRRLALTSAVIGSSLAERRVNVQRRSDALREYVLRRAGGICEGCQDVAPFETPKGKPYLEPHHTTRLADGGPDHPEHVIALCPTCHRRVHYARDGAEYNAYLIARLEAIERGIGSSSSIRPSNQ